VCVHRDESHSNEFTSYPKSVEESSKNICNQIFTYKILVITAESVTSAFSYTISAYNIILLLVAVPCTRKFCEFDESL